MRRGVIFCLALLLIHVLPAGAAQKQAPETLGQMQLSFAPLVRQTGPAVVNVYARTKVKARSAFADDPFFRRFFGDNTFGMPRERVQNALGSGVIVDSSGVIVTNHHVVRDATAIRVVLPDRREFDAKVLLADQRSDLAVLKIDAGKQMLPFIALADSDEIEVGDIVLAIGNPSVSARQSPAESYLRWPGLKSESAITSSLSRPMRRSIPAIPAERW
jgi:S1-C subfamily serine protease